MSLHSQICIIYCFSLVAVFIPKCFSLACDPSAYLCKLNSLRLKRLVFCQTIITCETSLAVLLSWSVEGGQIAVISIS
ncbi:hypothetical protein ACB092_12G205200 [Castanea dentata]